MSYYADTEWENLRDLKLDLETWDLVFENGDIALVQGVEMIAQWAMIACKMLKGEFNFDTDQGLPYLDEILVKAPDTDAIASRVNACLLGVPGVTAVTYLKVEPPTPGRVLTIYTVIDTVFGPTGELEI